MLTLKLSTFPALMQQTGPVSHHSQHSGQLDPNIYNNHCRLTSFRPILNQSHNELQWNIIPAPLGTPLGLVCQPNRNPRLEVNGSSVPWKYCPHELWIALDLMQGGWDIYNKFTVRLSWPASVRCGCACPEICSELSVDSIPPTSLSKSTTPKTSRLISLLYRSNG